MKDLMKACHNIKKGFALIVTNAKFDNGETLPGVSDDEENIRKFCKKAGFTIYSATETHNLTLFQMVELFHKYMGNETFENNDAFICFISSHGNAEGILGTDCRSISIKQIVDPIVNNDKLVKKPKLFFLNSCRGYKVNIGIPSSKKSPWALSGLPASDLNSLAISIPFHADTIIAYSCWDEFESYMDDHNGSWFISVLTDVLNKYGNTEQLTDMLIMVNNSLSKMGQLGQKQMPCFTCSLLKPVKFTFP